MSLCFFGIHVIACFVHIVRSPAGAQQPFLGLGAHLVVFVVQVSIFDI